MDKNEKELAVADFRRAIELAPAEGESYFHAGQAMEALNRLTEAYTCYDKYVELAAAQKDSSQFTHLDDAKERLKVLKDSGPKAQTNAHEVPQSEFLKRLGDAVRRSKERGLEPQTAPPAKPDSAKPKPDPGAANKADAPQAVPNPGAAAPPQAVAPAAPPPPVQPSTPAPVEAGSGPPP